MSDIHFIIAIPTYKREALLNRAISSINKQNYPHLDVIVVDDAGEQTQKPFVDNTLGTKLHYFYHEKNYGVNQARNKLILEARKLDPSAFIVFIDDDDYLVDNALFTAAKVISEHPAYSWFTMDCITPEGGKISKLKHYGELSYLDDYMFGKTLRGDMMHIVKAEITDSINFSDRFKNGEEWYFWCQLSARHKLYAIEADGKVSEYLEEGISKSGGNRDQMVSLLKYKIETLEPMAGFSKLKHQYVSLAKHLLKQNNKQEAKRYLLKVFKASPGYIRQYKHWVKYFLS